MPEHRVAVVYFGADASWRALQRIGFRRRNTCLLREFARHPQVGRLVVVIPTTRNYGLRQRSFWRLLFSLGKRDKVQDVFVFAFIPGQRWFSFIGRLNRFLARWFILSALDADDKRSTIQWCYWPAGYQLARQYGVPGRIVFDADHNVIGDSNREIANREAWQALLEECGHEANLVVGASRSMQRWYRERGISHCARLRNGVDPERFAAVAPLPAELLQIPAPRIGYVGVLSKWVDYGLLAALAHKRPDWSFIVIGNHYKASGEVFLRELRNMHLLGERSATDVPRYLRYLDVGLALYRLEPWLDGDSMKIFEYLAAGLPTVTTPFHAEIDSDFMGLLEFAVDAASFEKGIQRLLDRSTQERELWNRRRDVFLGSNSWRCRANEALELALNAHGEIAK